MKLTFEKMFNLMKKRKITVDELCRKAGISHALISKMKKDTEIYKSAHEYSMNTLAQIAEALGVIPGSIMDLSDDDDLKARPDEKSTVIILPKGLSGIPYAGEGENPFIPDGKSLEECHRGASLPQGLRKRPAPSGETHSFGALCVPSPLPENAPAG